MSNEEQLNEAASENAELESQSTTDPEGEAAQESGGDAQLVAAQEEIAQLKDQLLRNQADAQNARRRAEKDIENAHKYALDKFSVELLPIIDNLERALESADVSNPDLQAVIEGIELTHKSFLDVLAKFNIQQLNPVGEPFDPQYHEAMSMVPAPDAEPNSVLNVVQKGYTLHGRLIRAAMVVVSQPAPRVDEQA